MSTTIEEQIKAIEEEISYLKVKIERDMNAICENLYKTPRKYPTKTRIS